MTDNDSTHPLHRSEVKPVPEQKSTLTPAEQAEIREHLQNGPANAQARREQQLLKMVRDQKAHMAAEKKS